MTTEPDEAANEFPVRPAEVLPFHERPSSGVARLLALSGQLRVWAGQDSKKL